MDILNISEFDRHQLFDNHPVVTKSYRIITPVIKQAYSVIRNRVYMRSTGTVLYGAPRLGKSTCADTIKLLLAAEFPNILIIKFTAETFFKMHSGMFVDILESEHLLIPKTYRFKDLQRKLITHIQSKLIEKKGNQFVLIIDEMHKLNTNELDTLATIHNRLESLGIKMTTLGFAQSEIINIRTGLQASSQGYLIARFLNEPIAFDGCVSQKDFEEILEAYDDILNFPEDSLCTFTSFFFPYAYEAGFRLKSFSTPIWKELQKASAESVGQSIPMLHLCKTIEYILVKGSGLDKPNFKLDKKMIIDAVESSGLSLFYQ